LVGYNFDVFNFTIKHGKIKTKDVINFMSFFCFVTQINL